MSEVNLTLNQNRKWYHTLPKSVKESLRRGGVFIELFPVEKLLLFFRGTWCPFCRDQLRILKENYEKMTACRIQVLGVVCQSRDSVASYLSTSPVPFPILCDEARTAAKAYGTHYWLSYEGVNLSNPALFILNASGEVTFQHIGRNMTDLPVTTVIERFCKLL